MSDLTPEETEAVRALLAQARHDEPVPADVAARLDATLAELSAERHEVRAPVVTLASRRRRMAANALVAAAAVVVLGVGIGQVLPMSGTDSGADESAAGGAADSSAVEAEESPLERNAAPDEDFSGSYAAEPVPESQDKSAEDGASIAGEAAEPIALVSDLPLRPQVRAVLRNWPEDARDPGPVDCLAGAEADGALLPVTWNGADAALEANRGRAGVWAASIYVCGDPTPVAETTVRLR